MLIMLLVMLLKPVDDRAGDTAGVDYSEVIMMRDDAVLRVIEAKVVNANIDWGPLQCWYGCKPMIIRFCLL
jgi:hypothetical protein